MTCLLVLPNQLFPILQKDFDSIPDIIIYEHPVFFTKFAYHKTKLAYHRATMRRYYNELQSRYKVKYIEFSTDITHQLNKYKNIYIYDPTDYDILKDLQIKIKRSNVHILETPLFIFTRESINQYVIEHNKKYINQHFYKWARHTTSILMEDGKPIGGKFSFDSENRLPFPKHHNTVQKIRAVNNIYTEEATKYVEKHFKDNPGDITFYLPIDRSGAKARLKTFLSQYLENFGRYQDAISSTEVFGYHSILSPMINIGLLSPMYVVTSAEDYYKSNKNISIASVEGFIRQILSWREYVRMLYIHEHNKLVKNNFFNHNRSLSKSWYDGSTGIKPIDDCIKKILKYSYAHHIERLMLLGGFMLIAQFKPVDVYKWFISMVSIDAYQWVMEPNVYGMSQFSCGDLMMTRPYFSSSNYIIKMSDYTPKSGDKLELDGDTYTWADIWTALYYNFIHINKNYLKKNYSLASSVSHWADKSSKDKKQLLHIAKLYLKY
jgi:deoxyribodipyrimidine photolyase-related protein